MISREEFTLNLRHLIHSDRILLAVSGGMDSMCLLHLVNIAGGVDFAVAHCNYQLRGEESNLDEELVHRYCEEHQIPFYSYHFNTLEEMRLKGTGLQETARNLRFAWFNTLCAAHEYRFILTGHHLNDHAETVLMNMARGTGIRGLQGIKQVRDNKISPLIGYTRKEIETFVHQNNIPFREDQSNQKDNYKRNAIRHHVLPVLEQINPSFLEHTKQMSLQAEGMMAKIATRRADFVARWGKETEALFELNISGLNTLNDPEFMLYYLLSPYGFNSTQVNRIFGALTATSGLTFHSSTHTLLKDRECLFIKKNYAKNRAIPLTDFPCSIAFQNSTYTFEMLMNNSPGDVNLKDGNLYLDPDQLNRSELTLRIWEPGDSFIPFGMKNRKKISDFFIDKKVNRFDKENALLLISGDEIAALIPYQISNLFRLTGNSQRILKISRN